MNEPYLFEKAIGQQMGDLCRLAVGDAKVTQTGEIVTLEDMSGRGTFGVSVEVPYTEGGVQSVRVTRCGKNLLDLPDQELIWGGLTVIVSNGTITINGTKSGGTNFPLSATSFLKQGQPYIISIEPLNFPTVTFLYLSDTMPASLQNPYITTNETQKLYTLSNDFRVAYLIIQNSTTGSVWEASVSMQVELGSAATEYEPYNSDTYTITLPADFYGGTVNLEAGTVTSRYAADGTELAEPVVTEIDPISIPILAGVNNVWADVGTVTVSYYAADAEKVRPALWYPTIYRGLTSARYLIKRASGAIASFDDAVAVPLVGLRVALPWRSEGYDAVEVSSIGYDRSTKWGGVQYDVDSGAAASKYAVGSEIEDTWGEYTAPWTVVNHYANGNMALQWKYADPNAVPFDAAEAIFYADANGLAAGTYHIPIGSNYGSGWVAGKNIQFTLARAMVEGDQFVIDLAQNNATDPTAGRTWRVYHAGGTEVLETGTTSDGTDGTLLGTIGAESAQKPSGLLNAISRAVYGYNRWSQSAKRQYYNSSAPAGEWWTLQNGWDRPPAQAATVDGFLRNFSDDFLQTLKPVEVVTALNTVEGLSTGRETTLDKIFLPSLQEMYINPQLSGAEGEDWDYYKTLSAEAGLSGKFAQFGTYEVLKKYNLASSTSAVAVWLRSAYRGDATSPWYIGSSGSVYYNSVVYAFHGCPACIIQRSGRAAKTAISIPATIYGGYLDVVTGQLVATHDADGNLLTNQKLYFLDPVNVSALAGVNNVWSDAGDVAVSYRIDNG